MKTLANIRAQLERVKTNHETAKQWPMLGAKTQQLLATQSGQLLDIEFLIKQEETSDMVKNNNVFLKHSSDEIALWGVQVFDPSIGVHPEIEELSGKKELDRMEEDLEGILGQVKTKEEEQKKAEEIALSKTKWKEREAALRSKYDSFGTEFKKYQLRKHADPKVSVGLIELQKQAALFLQWAQQVETDSLSHKLRLQAIQSAEEFEGRMDKAMEAFKSAQLEAKQNQKNGAKHSSAGILPQFQAHLAATNPGSALPPQTEVEPSSCCSIL